MPFPAVEHEEKKNFFLQFWRRNTSTVQTPSRHRFAQPHNQFQSLWKKSGLHTPPFMMSSERHDRQSYKQIERQLNAPGTYRIQHILSVIIYLCSPVKTSAAHNLTYLCGPTGNVQRTATIVTARRKLFIKICYLIIVCSMKL